MGVPKVGAVVFGEHLCTERLQQPLRLRQEPIQVFIELRLPLEDLRLLRDYFNLLLEHLRALADSEFMTTYKYSESAYTRKYLGLSQAKALIETFPYLELSSGEREQLRGLVQAGDAEGVIARLTHTCTHGSKFPSLFRFTCCARRTGVFK
jgi:hypothetical protein